MYRVALVNMPFAVLNIPSIALTQLKSRVKQELGEQVQVDVLYLNQDFAKYLGVDNYIEMSEIILNTLQIYDSGIGEWMFRELAFPELADNTQDYLLRYFPQPDKYTEKLIQNILRKKRSLKQFCNLLIDKYQLDKADLIGFTSMLSQNVACFAMSRLIKERNPNIVITMGGANANWPMCSEIAQHVPSVDFVFSGKSLKNFPHFVQYCLNKEIEKCGQIGGVFSKTNNHQPTANMGEELHIDIDVELNYDSFLDTLEENFPNKEVEPVLMFETSRGCWWGERSHCTFCGGNALPINYLAMKPENAIRLIQSLYSYYPRVTSLLACDNILPKNYIQQVLPKLTPPPEMTIFYEIKVGNITEAELNILSNAGVKNVQPGIESFATSTLKLMNKGTTAFENLIYLKKCLLHDINPVWNLLVGFPGETEDVYGKYICDLPLLTHLPPPCSAFKIRFDRFSPYHTKAKEYGLDLHPSEYYRFIYPFDEEILMNLVVRFEDHNATLEYRDKITRWVDILREKIFYWNTRWHDKSIPPQLYISGEGKSCVVYDSRSGHPVMHQVGEEGWRILCYLSSPRTIKDIGLALADIADIDPEGELRLLQKLGFIFQEDDRFLSLVLQHKQSSQLL